MPAPAPVRITKDHLSLIRTICDEFLASQPKHREFLKICADATIAGSEKIDWQMLEPIWSGSSKLPLKTVQNRAKTTASELRIWFREYYKREDVNDSWRFELVPETYIVRATPLPGFPSGYVRNPKISPREFASLIEDLVAAGPLPEAKLDSKVREWWMREKLPREPNKGPFEEMLRRLRSGGKDKLKLKFDQMRTLAEALEVHSLMIAPLLARPFRGGCLYLRLPDFIRPVPLPGHAYGEGASYAVQGQRYLGSDANFVYLWLRPNGRSDEHSHVGDEIMVPLQGEVDLLLSQSGARVPLREGEVAHFYAEQTHAAVNRSDDKPAFLFIIRSYHAALKGNSAIRHASRCVRKSSACWKMTENSARRRRAGCGSLFHRAHSGRPLNAFPG
jgi:quercetin dioxygenase-like cupin family protein